MNIAFVYSTFENIGIEYLSSMLKKHGHKTQLFYDPKLFDDILFTNKSLGKIFSFRKRIINEITKAKPDIVLFSVVSADYKWACGYAEEIKNRINTKIIFGGIHVTSVPDIVIKHDFVDYIVVGEGELAVVELVKSIESGKIDYSIKNVWFKKEGKVIKNPVRPLIKNIDKLPFPDKAMYRRHGQPFTTGYTMQSVRGCPNRCTYCNHDVYKNYYPNDGTYIRRRSIKSMMAELKEAHYKYNFKYIRFFDDDFLREPERLKKFCEVYVKELNIPYTCIAHPGSVTYDAVEILKPSNCRQVNVGFQNVDEKIRVKILNRKEKNEDAIRAIQLLKNANIRVIIDCMMGIPTSDENNMEETFHFFYKNTPTRLFMPWLQFFPMTKMCKIAYEHNILNDNDIKKIELDPYNKSILTVDKSVHNIRVMKYQTLFVALLVSRRLAWVLYKTRLYKYVPAESALFLSLIAYIKAWSKYEHEQVRNPRRYVSFMLRMFGVHIY